MINFALKYEIDAETCLLGTGIKPTDLVMADGLITRAQEMRLIENMMLALPDVPALGFKLGLQYNVATFGLWGFALRTSRTLKEACDMALRYLPLSTAYCHIDAFVDGDYFGLRFNAEDIPRHLRQFLLERDVATALNLLKELSLDGCHVAEIEWAGVLPSYQPYIEQVSGVSLSSHRSRHAILIHQEHLERPLPTYDAQLVQMLDHQCRQQLQRRQFGGCAERVRRQILGPLGFIASLDEVANALALSPRSLRRKLDLESTSFRHIVEEERCQLAQQLLRHSVMKIDELALHLGYTDTASFNRAFRRWMNCSPSEYRKQ